jgi:LysM domain
MSTLSIASPRVAPESDVDARFDALVRAVPAQRDRRDDAVFETVFDLDYGQPLAAPTLAGPMLAEPSPVVHQPRARRVRVRAAARQPAPARTAVRLTRRGRLVLVFAFLALAVALMIPLAGLATASLTGGTPEPVRVIEVAPGDTLYAIAAELAEPGQIRAMVHRIQELNSLPGAQISEGQKLAVPRG